ncbi:MAG TPA: bacillithiol biosynthesis cysteine-adding enzyme BshC [Gemmatimonadaceae bacterium]|jgi:bacillithiol biosynthesis cysteine-adding enzyme BshC|nr:bacillithiol biosynthesis cysteine-adding enzyme BshC [Gemmatimonadaceae bacterium]
MSASTSGPRVLTTSLGGSALTRALLGGSGAAWLTPRPVDETEWRTHAEALRAEMRGRDWLAALTPALSSGTAGVDRLRRSAAEQGIVVTTGQQPGLFGGPMYTWTKALAVLALADEIQDATGVPVAPVFWAATDDTDLAEARTTHVAVRGGLEALSLPGTAADGASLRDVPLGDVSALLDALARATGSAVDPRVLERTREAYVPGVTVGQAYLTLLRSMLEPLGIAVLDGGDPAVRRAAHPILVRALERAGAEDSALTTRTSEMQAAGFEPQVSNVPSLTVVFRYGDGSRERVPVTEAAEAARRAAPGTLGPNVLLRPIVERTLLPTAAYVAGPGEIAYFAQVSALAEALGTAQPVALPRWGAIVVEPHIDRILQRYELSLESMRDEGVVERMLARRGLPRPVRDALERARQQLAESVAEIARAVERTGFPLAPEVVKGLDATVRRRVERFERRVLAAQKRRDAQTAADIATARAALFPLGRPQERVLNFIPILARHGTPLLDAMLERAREHARRLVNGVAAPESAPSTR